MKKVNRQSITGTLLIIMSLSGCASAGKSIGAGATSGSVLGAGVGALADPGNSGNNRIRNVLIGTAVGGVVGAGAGYATNQLVKNEKDESYQKGKADTQKDLSDHIASSGNNTPKLLPPRTEAKWIPDQVRGATFIPGHLEYIILESARWEPSR